VFLPESLQLFCDRCLVAIAINAAALELARLTDDLQADPLLHAGDELLDRCKSDFTRLALLAHNAFLDGDSTRARALAEEALRLSCTVPLHAAAVAE
jgi:hypothetical protein